MNQGEARAAIARAVARVAPDVDLDEIDPDAELQVEADLDSMDVLNIVAAIGDDTGIEIPERDYPQLITLAGFVDYLAAATVP